MPAPHVPDAVQKVPPPSGNCTACGLPMRLTSVEPHQKYTNLDVREFACDCGETAGDIVERLPVQD
jgi:hypothetical protein